MYLSPFIPFNNAGAAGGDSTVGAYARGCLNEDLERRNRRHTPTEKVKGEKKIVQVFELL